MRKRGTMIGLMLLAVTAVAGSRAKAAGGGEGCDSLAGVASMPRVDYAAQIQPIWEVRCSNCHVNHAGSPAGNLDLDPEVSWLALVDMPSQQLPWRNLVVPGQPAASYLLEKINCALPGLGLQMPRGRPALPLAEQALIRDWIAQGAREFSIPVLFEDGFESSTGSGAF